MVRCICFWQVGLGVMHRHLDLYKEIVWELHRIEQQEGLEQRRRQADREQGRRGTGGAEKQQQHEEAAAQRTEESREKATQKGQHDAHQSSKRDS